MSAPFYLLKITPNNAGLSTSLGITVTTEIRSAESLGLAFGAIQLNNLEEDVCTLSWVRNLNDIPPFLPKDLVTVYQGDLDDAEAALITVFLGRVQPPEINSSDDDISAVYALHGPFADLKRHTFVRHPYGVTELELGELFSVGGVNFIVAEAVDLLVDPVEVPAAWVYDARGHLFDPPSLIPPEYRNYNEQLAELLQYVLDRMDDEPGGVTFQFDVDNWELGVAVTPRASMFQDSSVAELVVRVLAVKPDASLWFDYTQTPPMLRLRVASEAESEEITLATENGESLRGKARSDLMVSGVVIRYDWQDWGPYGYQRGWSPAEHVDFYPLTSMADAPDVLTLTFVGELYWYEDHIAEALYNSLNTLRFQGQLVLYDPERAIEVHPGSVFTIAGDHASMTVGQLLVQGCSYDTATGHWRCQCGLPPVLGVETLRDLRGWMLMTFVGPACYMTRRLPAPG
jgi:hypothetical protein